MKLSTTAALPLSVLITPFSSSVFETTPCLQDVFYGNYQNAEELYSVFMPHEVCLAEVAQSLDDTVVLSLDKPPEQLVWVQQQVVDPSLHPPDFRSYLYSGLLATLTHLYRPIPIQGDEWDSSTQHILSSTDDETYAHVVYRTHSSALLSVDAATARTLDQHLPASWKSLPLPSVPTPYLPVPPAAVDRVSKLLQALRFDPTVAGLVNNISLPQMVNDIRFLTGEDTRSKIVSRHSFSSGARTAARWLKERFEETGAKCTLEPFLEGFAPNVVCRYQGTLGLDDKIIVSAHYDSRGSFGGTRAPGGDDDGSGTTALLAIARTIERKKVRFHHTVELIAFAGEEQGLLGSRAYAKKMREQDANVILMIQADMIAYRALDEPPQLGLPARIGTTEVTELVANISAIYSPELTVGFTAACCSDHQSFHEQGFPATQVFERAGPIIDPMYHNSGDLSAREGFDFDQLRSIAKVQFATLLHAAGFHVPDAGVDGDGDASIAQ